MTLVFPNPNEELEKVLISKVSRLPNSFLECIVQGIPGCGCSAEFYLACSVELFERQTCKEYR